MKKLLLVRHAKATHQSGLDDFERPLKPSGLHDAAVMAGRLKHGGYIPQLLVASPALRAISTANVFSQQLSMPVAEEIKEIYDANEDGLLNIICGLSDNYNFVGLVGHNPGIAQALYYLTGKIYDVHPGAIALVEFNTDNWAAITGDSGKLIHYDTPKE